MRKSIFPILTILTAFLIAALLAASCGGDEPGDAPTATADQAPAAQPTQAQADAQPTEPAPTATATPTATSGAPANSQRAPELVGIESWINSEPLTLEGLRGKVVLIDFWTYTCVNCLRTLPFLKEWHAKYSDNGLVIIGVHAPEFEFEKVRQNVVDATVVDGIEWPVAQDNDFMTWRAYKNNFWPAKYLIDKDGFIRYSHFGEGAYAETEEQIRGLLGEAGFSVSSVDVGEEPERVIDFRAYTNDAATRITRELYAGVERNYAKALSQQEPPYVAHQEYYSGASRDIAYEDPGDHVNQFIFLQGLWNNGLENLTHARTTENYEDYIVINVLRHQRQRRAEPRGRRAVRGPRHLRRPPPAGVRGRRRHHVRRRGQQLPESDRVTHVPGRRHPGVRRARAEAELQLGRLCGVRLHVRRVHRVAHEAEAIEVA